MPQIKKAVVLVSGGLDSATTLAIAQQAGFDCHAISFDYGQRHRSELEASRRVVEHAGLKVHKKVVLNLDEIGGSALTDAAIAVPKTVTEGIPVTYVPARNTVFLALALGWAEVIGAFDIFIGVNAVDYSGYPDCRPEFIQAFERLANLATRAGVQGQHISIHAPLIHLTKAQIIQRGIGLGVDYGMTISCYDPDASGAACGHCDACRLRREGFHRAGVSDPTVYQSSSL